jgi:hypothetical protein
MKPVKIVLKGVGLFKRLIEGSLPLYVFRDRNNIIKTSCTINMC